MRNYELGINAHSAANPVVKESLITQICERLDKSSFRESGCAVPTISSFEWGAT